MADAMEIAQSLKPLDLDGMRIMMDPPERFPAFLVMRLCQRPRLQPGERRLTGHGWRQNALPPLVQERGEIFSFTRLGREVAEAIRAIDGQRAMRREER